MDPLFASAHGSGQYQYYWSRVGRFPKMALRVKAASVLEAQGVRVL